ncbi:MAG: ABC transporter permease [Thaumarchaeota archaeon]|nr:ABC transporter permease [Nitrososphaerota archaeon]
MNYIRRRILIYIVVLIVILNLDFFLPRLVPGNAALVLRPAGSRPPAAEIQALEALFGLDKPLYVQYYLYLKNTFATWPPYLGVSNEFFPTTVWHLFASRIGWSLLLMISSLVLALLISYGMAAFSSSRRGGKSEVGFLYTSIVFEAVPVYWVALVLLWLFAVDLKWLPTFGTASLTTTSGLSYDLSIIEHAILPVVAMTLAIFGEYYLILRATAQEVLKSDYVVTAKTRGLKDRTIASGYILRNSLLPLVSLVAFSIAGLVGRLVLVEAVFGYPGVGDLLVDAIVNRDFPVVEGTLFLVTVLVIIGGIIGDILLLRLDPRLRQIKMGKVQ